MNPHKETYLPEIFPSFSTMTERSLSSTARPSTDHLSAAESLAEERYPKPRRTSSARSVRYFTTLAFFDLEVLDAVVRTSAIAGPDDPANNLFSMRILTGDDHRPLKDTSKSAVASSCEWKHEATLPPKPKQNMGIRAEPRRSSAAFTEGEGV
jgi:hypothetical protein